MKVLITGASGFVGGNFLKSLSKRKECQLIGTYQHHPLKFPFSENVLVDITDRETTLRLEHTQPDLILHCAALANIAQCEANPEEAHRINVAGTKNIVALAKNTGAKLVYISTDSVFDGEKGNYTEADIPLPKTVYGKTKLEGENHCMEANRGCLVARINVFGKSHCTSALSFAESILDKLKKGERFQGFADAIFTPLYLPYLLETIIDLVAKPAEGIFHITGCEALSKYEFAKKVARVFHFDERLIQKSSIQNISQKISYPKNTSLDNSKMLKLLNKKLPSLDQMLMEFAEDSFED